MAKTLLKKSRRIILSSLYLHLFHDFQPSSIVCQDHPVKWTV